MFKSNKKEVIKALEGAKKKSLDAMGRAGVGYVKAVTPVGVYPAGSGRKGGALRDSIKHRVDNDSVLVGSMLISELYPIYVHEGTRRQKSQPYIHDGIMGNLKSLRAIAERNYKL